MYSLACLVAQAHVHQQGSGTLQGREGRTQGAQRLRARHGRQQDGQVEQAELINIRERLRVFTN